MTTESQPRPETGKLWDDLLAECQRRRESTPTSASAPRPTLRLHQPEKHFFPELDRSPDLIAQPLRTLIRSAITGSDPWPLFVHGPAGTGKTRAALCLLDMAGGQYWTASGIAEAAILSFKGQLRLPWHTGPTSTAALWEGIGKSALIVLDEIGSREVVKDHAYECLKRVLDLREGKPLMALSNLDLQSVERIYDDRIASRLAAGSVLALDGSDRRLQRS